MAQRRELPVEDGEETGRAGVEDHVVDAPVAMHQRDATVVGRDMRPEPGDETLHVLDPVRLACAILLGPALHLAGEVAAGLAEVGQARRGDVDRVELRQSLVHRVEDLSALLARELRQRRIPEDAALDMGHEVERRAGDALVLAERKRPRSREPRALERLQDAKLALDHVRALEELARRLAAQHVAAAVGFDEIGRVRLAGGELGRPARPAEALDMRSRPGVERLSVFGKPAAHRAGVSFE